MSKEIFQSRYASIYNLFYGDKNYEHETAYICSLLKRFEKNKTQSILDLGCGTGGHDIFLSREGFQVTGVDQSDKMIDQALAHADGRIEFYVGNIQNLELNKKFDAVVSLFHVMSYQVTTSDILKCFITAKKHLNPGGIFIFDFWHGAGVLTDQPTVRVKRVENDQYRAIRMSEPSLKTDEALVDVKFTFFISEKNAPESYYSFEEHHHLRYWFVWELLSLLKTAGFENVYAEEWMSQKEISLKTWYGSIVAS
jgi:SAM-dependent methyltransferase